MRRDFDRRNRLIEGEAVRNQLGQIKSVAVAPKDQIGYLIENFKGG